jgi:hypothetical protein
VILLRPVVKGDKKIHFPPIDPRSAEAIIDLHFVGQSASNRPKISRSPVGSSSVGKCRSNVHSEAASPRVSIMLWRT